ncbi:MAG: aminotransferase class V-fold PLP-dependent enzyme [Syntrophomonadaceae bacterium]
MKTIYMDNAATSYPKPESVYQAMDYFNRYLGGNPGRGSHQRTLQAGTVLLDAREALARLFGIKDCSQIAFTLNITEALNLALKGLLNPGDHVLTTSMEHNAVARPLHAMTQQGIAWTAVPCAQDGSLDPDDMRRAIRPETRLICMLHASNVSGAIMPVDEVGQIARENDLLFILDSAQSAGMLPIDVEAQNIDVLAFTGHKSLFGPQGTGGLYIRPGIKVRPLKEGGTGSLSEYLEQPEVMPDSLESGTPNTPGLAGLLAGVRFIGETGADQIRSQEQALTGMLLDGLKEIKAVKLYGPADEKKQTAVLSFNIGDMDCGEVSYLLDNDFGVVTRAGLHCAPLAHRTLGTLEVGSCRLSPGYFNTREDVEQVVKAVFELAHRHL